MAVRTRADYFQLPTRASTPSGCARPAGWCRTSPASRCSATRPSSARTPSPTRPASTRTACSRSARTYEIMRPEDVGLPRTELVLGKHSGRHALRAAHPRPGLSPRRASSCSRSSRASRPWPIARRRFTTPTSRPWPRRRSTPARPSGRWRRSPATPAPARSRRPRSCLWHQDGTMHREARHRRRPGRRGLQDHRAHHRHRRASCATSRSAASRSARTPRARPRSRPSTTARSLRGRAVSTDIIEASALAFLQVINRIALRQQQPRLHPQKETVVNAT